MTFKKLRFHSVASQLLISVIPVAILGIFLTGIISYGIMRPHVIASTKRDVTTSATEAANQISLFFIQKKSDLDLISKNPIFIDYYNNFEFGLMQEAESYRKDIEAYLLDFLNHSPSATGIWFVDNQGREVVSIVKINGKTIIRPALNKWYLQPFSKPAKLPVDEIVLTDPQEDRQLGTFVLNVAPVLDEFKEINGAVILASNLTPVQQTVGNLKIGKSGQAYIGRADASPVPPWTNGPSPDLAEEHMFFDLKLAIHETPWNLYVHLDLDEFLKPLAHLRMLMMLLSVICAVGVAIFLFVRVDYLIRPIITLSEATDRLRAGDWNQRVSIQSANEIGTLSQAFNSMAESLQGLLENIRTSELRYRTTLDSSLDAIVGMDSNFKITTWNKGAELLFGRSLSEVSGQSLDSFLPSDTAQSILEMANKHGAIANHDFSTLMHNKKLMNLNLTMAGTQPTGKTEKSWSLVIRNVTEQKLLQNQLFQAEKLSAVGQLVAGVAHEINNPLTAVIGYSELLQKDPNLTDPETKEDISYIRENANRCRDIVGNLLRFVRKDPLQKKLVDLNEVVQSVLKLMSYRLFKKESVQVDWQEQTGLPKVSGDASQLEQVFLNLIHNACDAMSGQKGVKRISIRVEVKAPHLLIRVSDNGSGISPENQAHLFEPFFTTKDIGKGTGLGLVTCKSILQNHNGTIAVESQPGAGTTFVITLPIASEENVAPVALPKKFPHVVGKKILVIDDEDDLIPLMRQVLMEEGNMVDTANNGKEGLEKGLRSDYDLVIADIELGDIRGTEICRTIRKLKQHGQDFVFITGDLTNSATLEEIEKLEGHLIAKPFSVDDLLGLIRKIVHEKED